MRRSAYWLEVITVGVALLAACSSSGGGQPDPTAPVGTAAKPSDTGIIGNAQSAQCSSEFDTVSIAVETYQALNGGPPATETDLVSGGLLRETSKLFDITPDGAVVPAPGGPCG